MDQDQQAQAVVEAMVDAEAFVGTLRKGTPHRLTWQRQLHAHLNEIDGLMQILRMAIVMDRPALELTNAAWHLNERTQAARLAIAGSRADVTTVATLRLLGALTHRIRQAFDAGELFAARPDEGGDLPSLNEALPHEQEDSSADLGGAERVVERYLRLTDPT